MKKELDLSILFVGALVIGAFLLFNQDKNEKK